MSTKKTMNIFAGLLTVVMFSPKMSPGADLNAVLDTLTKEIKLYLDERNEKAIAIGNIDGGRSSGGRGVSVELTNKLTEKGINVVSDEFLAKWVVKGNLSTHKGPDNTLLALEVGLFDENNTEIKSFRERFTQVTKDTRDAVIEELEEIAQAPATQPGKQGNTQSVNPPGQSPGSTVVDNTVPPAGGPADNAGKQEQAKKAAEQIAKVDGALIDNPLDNARISGATVDFATPVKQATGIDGTVSVATAPNTSTPPINTSLRTQAFQAVNGSIKAALDQPQFHPASTTQVAASSESPFRIEIEATNGAGSYAPVNVISKRGFAFAELKEGQRYRVRIYNDADFDVGVELNIDGINSLALSTVEEFRKLGKWVIPARRSGVVEGWLIDPTKLDEFVITAEPLGVAAGLGKNQSIGMVTATFFPAWQGDVVPPFQQLLGGQKRNATGRGATRGFTGQTVNRNFGTEPLAMVTVRYNNPEPPDLPEGAPVSPISRQ